MTPHERKYYADLRHLHGRNVDVNLSIEPMAKRKVLAHCKQTGCTVDMIYDAGDQILLEVLAPDGKWFDGTNAQTGLSGMLCDSWEDALSRVNAAQLLDAETA